MISCSPCVAAPAPARVRWADSLGGQPWPAGSRIAALDSDYRRSPYSESVGSVRIWAPCARARSQYAGVVHAPRTEWVTPITNRNNHGGRSAQIVPFCGFATDRQPEAETAQNEGGYRYACFAQANYAL